MNRTPIVSDARVLTLLERIADGIDALRRDRPDPNRGLQLLNADAFAKLLGVDVRTLRAMRHAGEVPKPMLIGRSLRWNRACAERFLERQQQ